MTAPLQLTEGEKMTPIWLRIEEHLKNRLDTLRLKNDRQQSEQETAALRGQISEVKSLLNIAANQITMD